MNREPYCKLPSGLQLYKVKLVGGPLDGTESLCSHDTVYKDGQCYIRGADDLYYYTAERSNSGQEPPTGRP